MGLELYGSEALEYREEEEGDGREEEEVPHGLGDGRRVREGSTVSDVKISLSHNNLMGHESV